MINAPVLSMIDYSIKADDIVLTVGASEEGWGAILKQENDAKRHLMRYESGMWSGIEKTFDAGKREGRALLRTPKKLKVLLYGVKFVVEIDAKNSLHQLNLHIVHLPGGKVTQWITWIRLFYLDVRHIPSH